MKRDARVYREYRYGEGVMALRFRITNGIVNYIEKTLDYVEEFFFLDKGETLTPKLVFLGFASRVD